MICAMSDVNLIVTLKCNFHFKFTRKIKSLPFDVFLPITTSYKKLNGALQCGTILYINSKEKTGFVLV